MAAGQRGRVESALEKDLVDRPDIGPAARGQLRAQARAVDVAEQAANPELVSKANAVYLSSLTANGLTCGTAPVADSFAALLAELSVPSRPQE
jgi:hypothetical protein